MNFNINSKEIVEKQKKERKEFLNKLKNSPYPRKIIVAGPGTGKTSAFLDVLLKQKGKNLAMTFMGKLADDMAEKLSNYAEVCTLHKFCKKILHKEIGSFEIVPFLPQIIEEDSRLLGLSYSDIEGNFQRLERGVEIDFYLRIAEYYQALGFSDLLYRLLNAVQTTPAIIPNYTQIIIDEFQDFNLLEVEIIRLLESKGKILIVGDDDQAIYSRRNSSPTYIREFYNREDYEKNFLPFSRRCTIAMVRAVENVISCAQKNGLLVGRIPKRYECYLAEKLMDSKIFPKIISAQFPTVKSLTRFIGNEIKKVGMDEIKESKTRGFPTVLITGPKQYLDHISRLLSSSVKNLNPKYSKMKNYDLIDGYIGLYKGMENFGWRIVARFFFTNKKLKNIVNHALSTRKPFVELLNKSFTESQKKAVKIIRKFLDGGELSKKENGILEKETRMAAPDLLSALKERKEEKSNVLKENPSFPTVLLTTHEGCKGLTACRTFVVGMNNTDLPRNPNNITDTEVHKLIVLLTRSTKCCYLLANKGLLGLKNQRGRWAIKERSIFYSWIPEDLISDLGYLKSNNIGSKYKEKT